MHLQWYRINQPLIESFKSVYEIMILMIPLIAD